VFVISLMVGRFVLQSAIYEASGEQIASEHSAAVSIECVVQRVASCSILVCVSEREMIDAGGGFGRWKERKSATRRFQHQRI
jgi:hypothetical protein